MLYEKCRIYGPYSRKKDNRQHVIVIYPDGSRITLSYPRYLVEMNIGRYLNDEEDVHHLDSNETNNNISNLVVVPRSVHKKFIRSSEFTETQATCIECKKEFIMTKEQARDRYYSERKGKVGPFCSKICAGKWSQKYQQFLKVVG